MQRLCHPAHIAVLSLMLVAATVAQPLQAAERLETRGRVVTITSHSPCCGDRCVRYRTHRPCRRCDCDCRPPIHAILLVTDPCCGCPIEVPVCLPACCDGIPSMDCDEGLFGRQIVTYSWHCGVDVKIVMNRNGDLVVHTYGG